MIIYPDRFKEAKPAGFDGVFDWDFLLPAFSGTKIQPMDIDAVVERRGCVLLFEAKDPCKTIPKGQEITLETLLTLGRGRIHLMIIYGKTPDTISAMEEWGFKNGAVTKGKREECNAEFVLQRVTDWFQWANSRGVSLHSKK